MAEPATKVQRYKKELEDHTDSVLPERAEWITVDLERALGTAGPEMDGKILALLSAVWGRAGDHEKALSYAKRALRFRRGDPHLYANIGLALIERGHLREAAEMLLDGVDRCEVSGMSAVSLFGSLAIALSGLGLGEESADAFADAEDADDGSTNSAFVLASQAAYLGDWPGTIKHVARFLKRQAGEMDDDDRAGAIVSACQWGEGWARKEPHIDYIVRVHRAMARERERLAAEPEPEVSGEAAEEAALRDLEVLEEMRPLRERANAAAFADVESRAQASH